jgi:hypothetical protein
MCAAGRDACVLTRELTNHLVALAALLARATRRFPAGSDAGRELRTIDLAFAEPIDLARKLSMAVHGDHDH